MFSNNNQYDQTYDPSNKNMPKSIEEINHPTYPNHVMIPQPAGLPWNIQGMPWGTSGPQPAIVEFTAQPQRFPNMSNEPKTLFPSKRKCEVNAPIPVKQMKTDEVMAAHLNCLHISPDFTSHSKQNSNMYMNEDVKFTNADELFDRLKTDKTYSTLEERLKSAGRIELCEEMKRFKSESIIPESILNKLDKPCMSLVLWKPPEKILQIVDKQNDSNNDLNKNNRQGRRSILMNDLNEMAMEL